MKILFLCHKMPFPAIDGGCIATLNMMKGLALNGAELEALCMATPKHNSTLHDIPQMLKAAIKWHSVFVNTDLKPINALVNLLFSKHPYNAVRFVSKKFEVKLIELLQGTRYDLIQLEGLYLAPYIHIIKKYSKAKIVLRSHNVEYLIWERMVDEEQQPIKKWYKNILYKRVKRMELNALKHIDALVPISSVDARVFEKTYKGKLNVSSTGINDDRFVKEQTKHSLSLFYIGALDWEPNKSGVLWFLNKVWQPLVNINNSLTFSLAGRNASVEFEKQVDSYGIDYCGEVESAIDFIDAHGIMIVPLFSGSGMRIKIIEAMARGKCIVTTPVGAEGIPVVSGEHILICDNAIDMIAQIKQLLMHPEKAKTIANNALLFAKKHYNNRVLTNELMQFYTQII